ncbi:kielin/chordin-like protein isoform X2 [Trichoplusia ni]|uniref:Kielin/chordin-like protein isoform X2 n=1 Tax=Trichoplusia ni TaxID=7111 RepID=A0A7E5W7N8_TRINI|nr:kielin/chordin-like protein isoform X2 [Trichoplusia ni]
MYGILWLTLWATVGEAFYDDYWFRDLDDGIEGSAWDSQRHLKHNFTEGLKSFHKLYHAGRDGEERMSMKKAKLHLKMLKIYRHVGDTDDFEPSRGHFLPLRDGAKYCTMGRHTRVDCNQCTCVAGQMYMCTGMICNSAIGRPKFLVTCREGKQRQIDACNYCFCRNGHEVCTEKECNSNSFLDLDLRSGCPDGQRRQKDCNRCLCVRGEEYCTHYTCDRDTFSENLLSYLDSTQCKNGETLEVDCNKCVCVDRSWTCSRARCPRDTGHFSLKRERYTCIEGSKYYIDECNYCHCLDGKELCTDMECGNTNYQRTRICTHGETKNERCNSCYCFIGSWLCSKRSCDDDDESYDDDLHTEDISSDERCNKGDTKAIDCNTCECHHGEWICSLAPCLQDEKESLHSLPFLHSSCTSNHRMAWKDCNKCICIEGVWYCAQKLCHQGSGAIRYLRDDHHSESCKENEKKYKKCNRCVCRDARWVCTQRECFDFDSYVGTDIRTQDSADQFYLKPCISGERRYKNICNPCICMNEKWYCQTNFCGRGTDYRPEDVYLRLGDDHNFYTAKCRKGSKRKKDACNYCYCRHKIWFCQNKACVEGGDLREQVNLKYHVMPRGCPLGDIKITNCKYCVCLATGYQCRLMKEFCIDPKTGDRWLRSSKCVPGTKYTIDYCNSCYCGEKGEYICTNNPCSLSESLDNLTAPSCDREDIGKTEQINSCNYCYCNSDQKWQCTNNECLDEDLSPLRDSTCHIGERYRQDACNYCFCNYDRELICTNNSCPQYRLDLRTSQNCAVGEREIVDACNYCECNLDEEWECTHNPCPETVRTTFIGNRGNWYKHKDVWNSKTEAPKTYLCIDGTRNEIDACNYCVCLDGIEFCTRKNCRTKSYFVEALCLPNEPLPKPDPCNECICLHSAIACSKIPCIRKKQVAGGRSHVCIERQKYYMDDGCNYCVCSNGQEFCTSRACMMVRDTNIKCKVGDIIPPRDSCNMCVCVRGKVTCTNKVCKKTRRQGFRHRKLKRFKFGKLSPMIQSDEILDECKDGFFYNPPEYDPECPNICYCDRGELLCTDRPCRRPKVLPPEWGTESVKRNRHHSMSQRTGCFEFDLPPDANCRTCRCVNNEKVCEVTNCILDKEGIIASLKLMHEKKEKQFSSPDLFCTPFTFFSPDNNRFCRNCFCLHNGLALCLLNFCKYSKDVPHEPPESVYDKCNPGEVGYPTKCVSCKCTNQGKWACKRDSITDCGERNCDSGDEFQMGFQTFCAFCKCSSTEWYCSVADGPCSDFSNLVCPMGTLIHNPSQFCSLCLCGGPSGSNMCFTESKCVHQVSAHLQ